MLDIIFYWIGVIVCVAGGFAVTGIFVGLTTKPCLEKVKEVHTLAKLMKIIRENNL